MVPLKPLLFLRAIGRFFWTVLLGIFSKRPPTVPTKVTEKRHAKCNVCPHRVDDQCGLCSCFIGIKVLLSSESCPDKPKRWGEYYSERRSGIKSS